MIEKIMAMFGYVKASSIKKIEFEEWLANEDL